MRIIHTADWHIGQTLNGFARDYEHQSFLNHLAELVETLEADALIVAGDVFDGINPSGEAQRMLFTALAEMRRRRPHLTTVMVAGNHDPAGRLEAPSPVLDAIGVRVIGTLAYRDDSLDMERHLVPLRDVSGQVRAHVLALPFLRPADLPALTTGVTIPDAVKAFHDDCLGLCSPLIGDVPLIATGHLHCAGGTESEGAERRIMIGGEHAVPPEAFDPAFAYVALGHLHRPQNLAGGRVRYCGSAIPLSASEVGYDHGVTLLTVDGGAVTHEHIPVPRPVPCHKVPTSGSISVTDLAAALDALGAGDLPRDRQPFVYINLTADGPAANILTAAEAVLQDRSLRVAGLRIASTAKSGEGAPQVISLDQTTPEALFKDAFEAANLVPAGEDHLAAFREAEAEV